MKKLILTTLLSFAAASVSLGQGLLNFSSLAPGAPPVLGLDGTPVGGANYLVELLVLNPTSGNFEGGLQLGGNTLGPIEVRTGNAAGLFTAGGTVTVPFVAGGDEATMLVRAWDTTTGADYAAAVIKGETTFTMTLGGPAPTPPNGILPHYQGIQLVPEPSTYALAALGLGGLLYFRRKK